MSSTTLPYPTQSNHITFWQYTDRFSSSLQKKMFYTASLLTDPVCLAHETFRQIQVVNHANSQDKIIPKLVEKFLLTLRFSFYGSLALITSMPGVALRFLAIKSQGKPFLSYNREDAFEETAFENRKITLLSWNVCFLGGGYSISEGGVFPWRDRIDRIIQKILMPQEDSKKSPDVVCLYETFDTSAAFHIVERLKKEGYNHIFWNIGPKTTGVSSGILVASRFKIINPEFSPFPLDTLVGRTKGTTKGVFSFDLEYKKDTYAKIFSTHLQHSELPKFPTIDETIARESQMRLIMDQVDKIKNQSVIITGDLNLDDEEYEEICTQNNYKFTKNTQYGKDKTWEGDLFCAELMRKKVSSSLNLDHTIIRKSDRAKITTTLLPTGYDDTKYLKEALSDHRGLFSIIRI